MTEYLQIAGLPFNDEAHYQRILSNFEDAKIICEGRAMVGHLKLCRTSHDWHLHQIQILPAYQRRGIGEVVLMAVLAAAEREGVPVSLTVLHRNPARRLYERLGFKLTTETSIDAAMIWRP